MQRASQEVHVTIMGSGSAYGVPTAGNGWGQCNPHDPANRRLTPSLLIRIGSDTIIIDVGPDFREQANRHEVRQVSGILFTHSHADHILGMYELPKFMQWQSGNIDCYATGETLAGIRAVFGYLFDPVRKAKFYGPGEIAWHEIEHGRPFQVGSLSILPIHQDHGSSASTGFRVGDIAYSTDVKSLRPESKRLLHDLSIWILDCNELEPSAVHNDLEQAIAWAHELSPKLTVLTHLSESIDCRLVSNRLPVNVRLAVDGMTFVTTAPEHPRHNPRRKARAAPEPLCPS